LRRAALSLVDWKSQRELDEFLPLKALSGARRPLEIDYLAPGGPMIEARAQEFYGLSAHPTIARGKLPLVISMLSPANRQIAVTKDLPSFWNGGYLDMAKAMRGEYPKHDWPTDPASAPAHAGLTKARLRDRGD
jgi:ATP-dependent helicase HrpB